jgi:DNA-binding transcriptional LysR family regulator
MMHAMGMDWNDLRVFLAVARAGRLAQAARQLGVEHTTVGRRLAALEAELGVPLFHRTASGHLLTPHGENVLASAEAMERAALDVGARAREHAGAATGRVRLALIPEFASHWLAPRLPAFRAAHPGIDLHVLVGTRPLDLARGEAELAVRGSRPTQSGLAVVRLAQTRTGLYAARALVGGRRWKIAAPGDLRDQPLLVYTAPHHPLQSAAWFQPVLAGARVTLASNSTHMLLGAARAGAGVAVLPRFVAAAEPDLVPVSDDTAVLEVWLVTHPEFRRDPSVRLTAAFLRREAPGLRTAT